MKTEVRLLLAVALTMGVIFATSLLTQPEAGAPDPADAAPEGTDRSDPAGALVEQPAGVDAEADEVQRAPTRGESREVTVSSPLYRFTFSTEGAALVSAKLLGYPSFQDEEGAPVELIRRDNHRALTGRWAVGSGEDRREFDLAEYVYVVEPAEGIELREGDGPKTLVFRYAHPEGVFFNEVRYTFQPDSYVVLAEGTLPDLNVASSLQVKLPAGLEVNELNRSQDTRAMAVVGSLIDGGIRSRNLRGIDEPEEMLGPMRWAAIKSKFFVVGLFPGSAPNREYFLDLQSRGLPEDPERAEALVRAPVGDAGGYAFRAYLGPMERERLIARGDRFEEVNPYGWKIFRPVLKVFVEFALWMLDFLHDSLKLGYGWVLIVFGVLLRAALWPLYQKAMRSQMAQMAIQPILTEVRERYKGKPEMNQELAKVMREHKVNPLGGCLPMLIPWPLLIALFFVFQNTIQLRGEPFLWLVDLSAADPLFILPIAMGLSMFLVQWISMRTMPQTPPHMKMMMYVLPGMMTYFFWQFPSGLNLYYLVTNIATIPQQILMSKKRAEAARKAGITAPPAAAAKPVPTSPQQVLLSKKRRGPAKRRGGRRR